MKKWVLTAMAALVLASAGAVWMSCGSCCLTGAACAACVAPAALPATSCCSEEAADEAPPDERSRSVCGCLFEAEARTEIVHETHETPRLRERGPAFVASRPVASCRPPVQLVEQFSFPDSVVTEVLRL